MYLVIFHLYIFLINLFDLFGIHITYDLTMENEEKKKR
jgi:hypothetical protein